MDSIRETRQLSILAETLATDCAAIIAAIGAIAGPTVPAADSPDNILSRDVVGNKADLQVQSITDTYSIIAYIKGLMDTLSITGYAVFPGASAPGPNVSMISVIHYISDIVDNAGYGLSAIKTLVDDLETRLTAARAGYLDNINNAQLLNITAARLGYVDLLADGTVGLSAIEALVDDLETRLTAGRAALLDQITALRMAELDAANIPADIDNLKKLIGSTGTFNEQEDVPLTYNTDNSEDTILSLNTASTRYILRSLWLKFADPGVNTITVRLKLLINDVSTTVRTFDITTLNYGTYYSLMDLFGHTEITGDSIIVTTQNSAVAAVAVTGQYSYGKTNV